MKRISLPLGKICDLIKGTSPIVKTAPGRYPLVTTGRNRKTADTFQFDTEAVCIPLVSSTGHGHASLNRVHYQSGKFALGNILAAVIAKEPSVISIKFLERYLNHTKDRLIVPLMTGVANMSLSIDRLKTVPIEFPELSEQERIIKILDEADALRNLRAQSDSHTTTLIPALFHKIFGDPTVNLKGWPLVPLGEIAPLKSGYAFSGVDYCPEGIRLVRISNLTGQNLLFGDNTVYLPHHFLNKYSAFTIADKDILIAMSGATTGKIAMVQSSDTPSLLNQRVGKFYISDTNRITPVFLFSVLNSSKIKEKITFDAVGAAQPNISSTVIGLIKIPIPPILLQREFTIQAAEIRELEAAQSASRSRLEALFQSLLHRAFNGTL